MVGDGIVRSRKHGVFQQQIRFRIFQKEASELITHIMSFSLSPSSVSEVTRTALAVALTAVLTSPAVWGSDATTKIAPSDFTVGSRLVMGGKLREALVGDMAGLAVFNRALSDDEMKTLHAVACR